MAFTEIAPGYGIVYPPLVNPYFYWGANTPLALTSAAMSETGHKVACIGRLRMADRDEEGRIVSVRKDLSKVKTGIGAS